MNIDSFFDCIVKHHANELPFVVYRKPQKNQITALLQDDDKKHVVKNFMESGFVFAPFDNKNDTILIPFENVLQADYEGVSDSQKSEKLFHTENDDRDKHIHLVFEGIKAIENGKLRKVVLSRAEQVSLSKTDPIKIFKQLLDTYTSAYVYCWFHPKVGLWLGATPETLLSIDGRQVCVMSLAGTQTYDGTQNVEWQGKEQEEQQYVTDYIVEHIQNFVNNISLSETETTRAGNLLHLRTKITGVLKGNQKDLSYLIKQLHPTPAVCGVPKDLAKDFILKHENYDREFYTGFLGELNLEQHSRTRDSKKNVENRAYRTTKNITHLYVNLRCAKLESGKATVFVGGGITQHSIAEKEWEETVSKSMTLKRVL